MRGERLAAIVSAGCSRFGKLDGLSGREILVEAAREAWERCPKLDPKSDVEAIFVGNFAAESFEHQSHLAPMTADWLGLNPKPAIRIENACASSSAALRSAIFAVRSGLYEVVLVVGVEKMTNRKTPEATEYLGLAADHPLEQWSGLTFPALFALMATAHMHKYGTTQEQLAMVAVKNHYNGARNPKAHMQKEITLDAALKSKLVAWPLKLFDCSLISDGACCLVVANVEAARRFTDTPIYVVGSGQASDTIGIYERDDLTALPATVQAARQAYAMAGLSPREVDVAEVHDCFTIAEIMAYEGLGFCEPGEGGKLVQDGVTGLEGEKPVNTSGGLKAKGHPVGATGAAQVYEIYLQLTGQAGGRQVDGAAVGLTHNLGGSGGTAIVHVFRR